MFRRTVFGVAIVAALLVAPGRAVAAPTGCPQASSAVAIPAGTFVLDWVENVGYDADGGLWVSRVLRNEVQRYDASGRLTTTVAVESPGAIRLGPDGAMYVLSGDSPVNQLTGSRTGAVVRFDPRAAAPAPEVFASGLGMPNGAAFGPAGELYVADGTQGLVKIRPDGSIDPTWPSRANGSSVNGVAPAGDALYVTLGLSPIGRVLRVPLADPTRSSVVADLLPGAGTTLPDDLVVAPDGAVYVTTTLGQLVRVGPGSVCTVLATEPLTSLAAIPGTTGEYVAGAESGNVRRVTLG